MRSGATRIALITGGAGFIGSNLAERLLQEPDVEVRIFDNFSRRGVHRNAEWLRSHPEAGRRLQIIRGDVRNASSVQEAAREATEVYHLAAQVAVTTSVADPVSDFETNALGTLNALEAARTSGRNPFFLFTSTNKVYGSLDQVPVKVDGNRYCALDRNFNGVREDEAVDFHSPYGCSKGCADQYVRDYARIYDLPTVVFRMSCIAGPRQFGNEDQGWVAHFLYSVLSGSPIAIYGDGYQVRDVLHVYDLVDAMLCARRSVERTRGRIYNLGGGVDRVVSVIEMLKRIEKMTRRPLHLEYKDVRPGDQPLYISNTARIERDAAWRPTRSLASILEAIYSFWGENREAIESNLRPSMIADEDLIAEGVA